MSEEDVAAGRICQLVEHWVVLAASVFITACATGNFTVLQLLKQPIRFAGRIDGGVATLELPKWFPAQEAVFEAAGGALYAKLRDLPLQARAEDAGQQNIRLTIDLRATPLPQGANGCTLTYFPWFRFLSEPVNFEAVGQVAEYVSDCLRFLLVRNGIAAAVERDGSGDKRHIRAAGGFEIEIAGMQALRSIAVSCGPMRSLFDLDARRLEIDRRMFPAAYESGEELLKSADRLINLEARIDGDRLHMAVAGGGTHVPA